MILDTNDGWKDSMRRRRGRTQLLLGTVLTAIAIVSAGFLGGIRGPAEDESVAPTSRVAPSAAYGIPISVTEPFDYAAIPPGTRIVLSVPLSAGVTSMRTSLDGGAFQPLSFPYAVETRGWAEGMRVLRVEALTSTTVVGLNTFVFFIDLGAVWPPDTIPVDVVLVGFDVPPSELASWLNKGLATGTLLTPDWLSYQAFDIKFDFRVLAANATFVQDFIASLKSQATNRTIQARLNITAVIAQRDTGGKRDIFDALTGWEIRSEAAERYLEDHPPVPPAPRAGLTYYLMNLSAIDDPAGGIDHWFVRPTPDPDTGVDQNSWRLEWDDELNIPVGFPLNAFGGPEHKVFLDPTAYQWYLDWANIWWLGGNGSAPYGLQYEQVPASQRASYLAGLINDLNEGLVGTLPQAPPPDPTIEVRSFILSGSANYSLDSLGWAYNESLLGDYLRRFLPFKTIVMNTTFEAIDAYPALKAAVDLNTSYVGGWGYVDGSNVWTYLVGNRTLYVDDRPGVFRILTINLLYDNRSILYAGREYTGLGGSGVTTILMNTHRLYYANGTRDKGITSVVSHETGHNLGYGHQFGPNFRADFIDGSMGYFRNELEYGTFWEDALHRVCLRQKLLDITGTLESRWPIDLMPEFVTFYRDYRELRFLGAYADLSRIEAALADTIPPVAEAGPDRTVSVNVPVILNASASTDNFRIINYTWDFGDGTHLMASDPSATKTWTREGVYTVALTVADAAGNRGTARFTVTVGNAVPLIVWIVVVAGAIIAAIAAFVTLRRRRIRESNPPTT